MQITGSEMKNGRGFTLDTPFRSGASAQIPMTRMLGHAISSRGLANVKPGDNSAVMIRANNLSALVAAMLLQIKPEKREWALTEIGGIGFTGSVLRFAGANTALATTEAIRFSLALHFMSGIVNMEAGKTDLMAEGYRKFARFFKDAQDRRARRPEGTTASASGLSGIGQAPPPPPGAGSTRTFAPPPPPGRTPAPAPAPPPPPSRGGFSTGAASTTTQIERDGYIPPAPPNMSWDEVGMRDPRIPSVLLTNIKSRDSAGRCIRWSPQDRCYPAPDDRPSVDMATVQWEACGGLAARTYASFPIANASQRAIAKIEGLRRKFVEVFGRQPNNSELQYYGSMQWCATDYGGPRNEQWGDPMPALNFRMVLVREDIESGRVQSTTPLIGQGRITEVDFERRTAWTDIAGSLKYAAEAAFDFLGKIAKGISDILCQGFKALFGEAVGGVICTIITFLTNMIFGGIAAIINIVIEAITGVVEFIRNISDGGEKSVERAFTALLRAMGRILFSLASPLMVPVLMMDNTKNLSMSQAMAVMKARADRVIEREPLWPLMVIMAVVGMFSAIGGNFMGALTGLITALAPMVATFISEPMKANIESLRNETLETIESGIAKFIKFILLLVNGALSVKGLIAQFRAQLAKFVSGKGAGGLTGDVTNKDGSVSKASPAQRIKYVLEKVSAGFAVLNKAFRNFNVKDIVKAAGPILMLIPDLLLAILPEDAAAAMPTLTEWKDSVKQSEQDVNNQEKILREGAVDIFNTFTLSTQQDFIKAQTTKWKKNAAGEDTNVPLLTPEQAAAVVAPSFKQQFNSKATYPAFVAAFRNELLKV